MAKQLNYATHICGNMLAIRLCLYNSGCLATKGDAENEVHTQRMYVLLFLREKLL